MSNGGQTPPPLPPVPSGSSQSASLQTINLSANIAGSSALSANVSVLQPVRIANLTISDFRGFPTGEPYRFSLENGKNLLLHGENGSGKTSFFQALRLLLSRKKPDKAFTDFQHIFAKRDASTTGVVAIDLTAGSPADYRWDAGNLHPSEDEKDVSFREIARRATFLDYKALLQTSFLHEDKDHINLFDLLVGTLLRYAEFPDGKTVETSWQEVRDFRSRKQLRSAREEKINENAKTFRDKLNDLLNADKVGIVAKTNQILAILSDSLTAQHGLLNQSGGVLAITLDVGELKVRVIERKKVAPPNEFITTDVTLRATYGGIPIVHPAIFFNEARLTAIALALYLATTLVTVPKATTANYARILILDDALIGLDLAHRLPLLDLLNGADFKDWQLLLLTFDASWFEMASERLPDTSWVKYRLHAKAHEQGWEIPILETDAPYLDRAWRHIQNGDFKAAGVYLRTAWENVMRKFCEAHYFKVPLKPSTYDYKAEEFWNLVKNYEFKPKHRLVDDALAGEIKISQDYVLNPLCHNDPARPTREEVRRAHGALQRLKDLLEQDVAWRKKYKKTVKEHIDEFALVVAGEFLGANPPPTCLIATLLRNSFDQALWRFCAKKKIPFTFTCDVPLTTYRLWHEATSGPGGLGASQAAFVAAINGHADMMITDSPDTSVFSTKSLADLQSLFDALRGASPANAPKIIIDSW